MTEAGCRILDAGCWMQDTGCWMLDAGCRIPDSEYQEHEFGWSILKYLFST